MSERFIIEWMQKIIEWARENVPDLLDWIVSVLSRVFICCATLGLLWYGGWAAHGDPFSRHLFKQTATYLGKNWGVGMLIILPLYYLPVRKFLEELETFYGAKRRSPPKAEEKEPTKPRQNPKKL
jgi:hypothetical protein